MPAIPGSVPVTGFVAPNDSADAYPSHAAAYGKGGHRSAADITARNAITSDRREIGMDVYVVSNDTTYRLVGGILDANWQVVGYGSAFPPFVKNTVAEVRAIPSSQFNKTLILTGESAAFDGLVSGIYVGVLDPSETGVDDGISIIVPDDRSSAASADKMHWRKP
jgi:hypothetical protein